MFSNHQHPKLQLLGDFARYYLLKGNVLGPLLLLIIATAGFRTQQLGVPLVDFHAIRQCDTAAIARNLFRNGMNLFWPQVDWAGTEPGYVGTEFPLYQGIVALLYNLFGLHESLGRGIS